MKQEREVGAVKLTRTRVIVLAVILISLAAGAFPARLGAVTYPVSIALPTFPLVFDLKVYDVIEDPLIEWTEVSTMDFGTLTFDSQNKIFSAGHYHVVEAAVSGNSQNNWIITVTNQPFLRTTTPQESLGEHVVVKFFRAYSIGVDQTAEDLISTAAYSNSAQHIFQKSDADFVLGGWLRIYYGFAPDRTPVTGGYVDPPGADTLAGRYAGNVLITCTL